MILAKRRSDIPPFSRIAFQNLGNERQIVEKLNRELDLWIRSKKGTDDLIERIRKTINSSYSRAATIAQTERTRVQNEARLEAIKELNRTRVGMKRYRKQWIARRDNKTRDTHADLGGTIQYADRYFVTKTGAKLMYPGDPLAPPGEIINCRCYIRKILPKE